MEFFEIHITGDSEIIEKAKAVNLKTIVIDLLKPDGSFLRTEYMTSQVNSFNTYDECKKWVDQIVPKLGAVCRVKIESPYYEHYVSECLY